MKQDKHTSQCTFIFSLFPRQGVKNLWVKIISLLFKLNALRCWTKSNLFLFDFTHWVCTVLVFSAADHVTQKAHVPHEWIVGGLGIGLALIILTIIVCVALRSPNCLVEAGNNAKDSSGKISNKFYVFGNPSLFCGCVKPVDQKQTDGESSSHQITGTKTSSNHPTYWTLEYTCYFGLK